MNTVFLDYIKKQSGLFHPVVNFNALKEKIKILDLTERNQSLTVEIVSDTGIFSNFINQQRSKAGVKYLIGGYDELRNVYARSPLFGVKADNNQVTILDEPRRLHLGIDIWGEVTTPVYSPLPGLIHSFAFNKQYGDYGATLILEHKLERLTFYTLFGHLSLADIYNIEEGQYITKGQVIGHFGSEAENGHWPPHLHFQVILNIGNYRGDYPGVCRYSERAEYLNNSPNPDLLLNLLQYAET